MTKIPLLPYPLNPLPPFNLAPPLPPTLSSVLSVRGPAAAGAEAAELLRRLHDPRRRIPDEGVAIGRGPAVVILQWAWQQGHARVVARGPRVGGFHGKHRNRAVAHVEGDLHVVVGGGGRRRRDLNEPRAVPCPGLLDQLRAAV
jgi:hypothetical protein